MSQIQLYDFPLSGNCYKIRLMLSLLGLDYERLAVDLRGGETQTEAFKRINPRGQVPVLIDGDQVIWDSMAILIYLGRRYGGDKWLPKELMAEVRVVQWLAVSENELLYGLARARLVKTLNRPFNLELCQQEGRAGLAAMEAQLGQTDWLCGDHATIADIACYPYVALANEGEVSLDPYPAVATWTERVKQLPGWTPMLEA